MKNLICCSIILFILMGCKKEGTVSDEKTTENIQDSTLGSDTTTISPIGKKAPFLLEPIEDQAEIGKVIFIENGRNIISYDTQANAGKINIDGKIHLLNKLSFTENNYEISGEDITITAQNGNFGETASDCNYADFPKITIKFKNQKTDINNVRVQDCPLYQ